MERKDIDWGNLGFGYVQTDMRYVSNFRNGQWDDGCLTDQATITMSECACVLQYAQTCFEGLKAYTTEDGRIVCFRPDLNAQRMASSCRRLKMPVFPEGTHHARRSSAREGRIPARAHILPLYPVPAIASPAFSEIHRRRIKHRPGLHRGSKDHPSAAAARMRPQTP